MPPSVDDRKLVVGAVILVVAGGGLIALAPIVAPEPPAGPVSVAECELVQLAVYEAGTDAGGRESERYSALTETQRSVFDRARAADGDFVRIRNRSRMIASESLPHRVVLNGTPYRANSVLGNCRDRPWYAGLVKPGGYVLFGAGVLVGGVVARRRLAY